MKLKAKPKRVERRRPRPQGLGVGIVLVNWNRWSDTIECLESLFRSTIPVRVAVVDNASSDGSMDRIAAWARGDEPSQPVSADMANYSQPPIAKPVAFERLTAADLASAPANPAIQLTLIDSAGNLGFAGGNNLGLRALMKHAELDCFWLLNNDTVIAPDAAEALMLRMHATDHIGMCGTVVRYYHDPDRIQALNGSRFNFWTGQSQGIGKDQFISDPFDPARVAAETDFVLGASLGVSRDFLETVGPMEETYFLYYEEIDWSTRGAAQFRTGFANGAMVWHKEGGSAGSSGVAGARSGFSEYWLTRSRLRFVRRYHPLLLPWHWLLTLGIAGRRLVRVQPAKTAAILRAMTGRKF